MKTILASTLTLFASATLFAQSYEYNFWGNDGDWDNIDNWRMTLQSGSWTPEASDKIPGAGDMVAFEKDIIVSSNKTIAQAMTSFGTPLRNVVIQDGSSLTIDVAANNYAINIRNSTKSGTGIDGGLNFEGGTLNLTKTSDIGNATVYIRMTENSDIYNIKTVKFNTAVESTENVTFSGFKSSHSFVEVNDTFNAVYNGVYKKLEVAGANATFGAASVTNIGGITVSNNGILTLNGVINVSNGAKTTINVNGGSTLNINNVLTSQTAASTTNMQVDGTVNLLANGVYHTNGGYGNVNISGNGVLRLASGKGSFSAASSIRLGGGGRVIFDSADVWVDGGDGSNTRSYSLWMSSSSALADVKMSYIDVNAHTYFRGLTFGSQGTGRYGAALTVTFDSNADKSKPLLEMEYLTVACDTNQGFLYNEGSKLVLVNFYNGAIKLEKGIRNASGEYVDNFDLIFAEGFENFYLEEDLVNGGFWLYGVEVPEPASIAAIIGALSLGLIIVRRRK